MSSLSLTLPVKGESAAPADTAVNNAFTAISSWANGSVGVSNLEASLKTRLGPEVVVATENVSAAAGTTVAMNSGSERTVTLPNAPATGTVNGVINLGSAVCKVAPFAGKIKWGSLEVTELPILTGSSVQLVFEGSNWVVVSAPRMSGHTNIAAEQETSSASFVKLTTPDEVEVWLPENGLIQIGFQATWQQSNASAATAAIFIGANQMTIAASAGTAPAAMSTTIGGTTAKWTPLSTSQKGLTSGAAAAEYGGDVSTGQMIGVESGQPMCVSVFAAAGAYKVSVQFKASAGSVKAKNRKLWVEAKPF